MKIPSLERKLDFELGASNTNPSVEFLIWLDPENSETIQEVKKRFRTYLKAVHDPKQAEPMHNYEKGLIARYASEAIQWIIRRDLYLTHVPDEMHLTGQSKR